MTSVDIAKMSSEQFKAHDERLALRDNVLVGLALVIVVLMSVLIAVN